MEETYEGIPIRKIEEVPYSNKQTIKSRNKCGTGRPNRVGSTPQNPSPFNMTKSQELVCMVCGNKKLPKKFDARKGSTRRQKHVRGRLLSTAEGVCKKCKKKNPQNISLWSKQGLL